MVVYEDDLDFFYLCEPNTVFFMKLNDFSDFVLFGVDNSREKTIIYVTMYGDVYMWTDLEVLFIQ